MSGFVSHFTNRVDAKGRVSIPAPFRAALAKDGFEGLYCFPSPFQSAVDAGGNGLVAEIQKKLEGFSTLSLEYDALSTALYGASETLKVDRDGRFVLSDMVRHHAGIEDEVTFVGQGFKFQIWEPSKFRKHREEAMKRALAVLAGGGGSAASLEGAV
ncbi:MULTISPECIES: division/cell wall cluster transcriptional repressor MraZ [Pseudovibrio]|uniref:division/cell wall cluster transcriptional repressor MraZ n=1 Tax=Stappiaceae TaxID=2821832 RepID=UPI002366CC69|nr:MULTISPECIES: division/cell wall cluster transcriptional repressor MraZ [Pseudovibrio]MDD7910312.1 division/cell wall cluster transcriptional repressor MraZ [Pseudovibrio exalbescens]MDX5594027.1 division/cell wall cluster transcriptional repressor MraZ [Pseudovibrio sp. SPO723]